MKKYYIQSRVSTGAEILAKYLHNEDEKDIKKRFDCSFEYEGLYFDQWDFSPAHGALGDAWLINTEIEVNLFRDAQIYFLQKIEKILPRIFFSVPVWHSFGHHQSYLISNDEFQTGFYFMRKEREGTGLVITPEILEIIKNQGFHKIPDKFFLYYSEFINANTSLSGLSLGLSALEIIRPEENVQRKEFLGEELYYKIYSTDKNNALGRKEGIRHKIHHGKYPEEGDNIEKDFEDMHEAIRLCLLNINPDIQKIYDLRSNFKSIPRRKKDIEGYNGIYLFSENHQSLNLREIVKYDDTAFFEFQTKIKENLSISMDTSKKPDDY